MMGFLEGEWSEVWGFKEILRSNELRMTKARHAEFISASEGYGIGYCILH